MDTALTTERLAGVVLRPVVVQRAALVASVGAVGARRHRPWLEADEARFAERCVDDGF
jgi:hypothetical protein